MKLFKPGNPARGFGARLGNIKITQKLVGLLFGLLFGFVLIGLAYQQVLKAEQEAEQISQKIAAFETGIKEVQIDLVNARRSESDFYLKKYPIFLGKFDTRIIVASQNLRGLTKLVKEQQELGIVTKLGDAFETYRSRFIKAADSQIEIGLDDNTGLNRDILATTTKMKAFISRNKQLALDNSLLKINQYVDQFKNTEDERYQRLVAAEINVFRSLLEKAKLSSKVKLQLNDLLSDYKNHFLALTDLVFNMRQQKSDVKAAVKQIEPLFETLIETSTQIITDTRENVSTKRNQITTFFISAIIGIALAVSVALFMLARSIISPLRQLQSTVLKVNEGDITARTGLFRSDELGELAQAFDRLLDERLTSLSEAEQESEQLNESVISLIKAVSQLAQQKDLAVKIPVSEDITGAISDSLNLLAKETAKIMADVKHTSHEVAEVSNIVKVQSDNVISVADNERKEVESTAVLLQDTVAAMNEIARDAQSANSQADDTIKNTQRALDTVLSSVEGINSIRSTISETEKRIKRLGERSQEISGIVSLINSIAERTHILALNASMHAASAGEAGRGFAVVADEVQRLAENAREATSEISTVVNNIRVETADTVTTMNTAISQVAEGTRLAEQAGRSMKETQQATADLVRSVQQIANSSVKQADVSKQLLDRARQIQDSTEKTGLELIEQTKSTDKLVRFSEDLVSLVGVFKLPGETPVATEPADKDEDYDATAKIRQAG